MNLWNSLSKKRFIFDQIQNNKCLNFILSNSIFLLIIVNKIKNFLFIKSLFLITNSAIKKTKLRAHPLIKMAKTPLKTSKFKWRNILFVVLKSRKKHFSLFFVNFLNWYSIVPVVIYWDILKKVTIKQLYCKHFL